MLNWLLIAVGICGMFLLLIAPHEGGHFLAAKLFKVRVIEFSVGAGPKLLSFVRGKGVKLGSETMTKSDVILPADDMSLAEAKDIMAPSSKPATP